MVINELREIRKFFRQESGEEGFPTVPAIEVKKGKHSDLAEELILQSRRARLVLSYAVDTYNRPVGDKKVHWRIEVDVPSVSSSGAVIYARGQTLQTLGDIFGAYDIMNPQLVPDRKAVLFQGGSSKRELEFAVKEKGLHGVVRLQNI